MSGDIDDEHMRRTILGGQTDGDAYAERAVAALVASQATTGEEQRQHEDVALQRCSAALLGGASDRHLQYAALTIATITSQRLGRLERTVDERIPGDLGGQGGGS